MKSEEGRVKSRRGAQIKSESPTKPPPWGGFCFSVVKGVKVVIGVKVICFVDFYPDLISTTFANVPADLHELLSTAKNLPELNIRIYDPITSYFL